MAKKLGTKFHQNALPPVFLLYGRNCAALEDEVGFFLQSIFCATRNACQNCNSCLAIAERSHEEVHYVQPVNRKTKLDQIDAAIDHLSLQAFKTARVVVLFEIDTLNKESANRLLKTLEEPLAKNAIIVATTSRLRMLLPTVQSRFLKIFVQTPQLLEPDSPFSRECYDFSGDKNAMDAFFCAESMLKKTTVEMAEWLEKFERGLNNFYRVMAADSDDFNKMKSSFFASYKRRIHLSNLERGVRLKKTALNFSLAMQKLRRSQLETELF